jgi:hypothetical protein
MSKKRKSDATAKGNEESAAVVNEAMAKIGALVRRPFPHGEVRGSVFFFLWQFCA